MGLLTRGRIDPGVHARDRVGRKPGFLGVLADQVFARRPIDAENLVGRDVALDPLNVRSKLAQRAARGLGCALQFCAVEAANAGHVSLNDEFRHLTTPF